MDLEHISFSQYFNTLSGNSLDNKFLHYDFAKKKQLAIEHPMIEQKFCKMGHFVMTIYKPFGLVIFPISHAKNFVTIVFV